MDGSTKKPPNKRKTQKNTPDGVPYHSLNDFKDIDMLDNGGYSTVFKGCGTVGNGRTRKKRTVAIKIFSTQDKYSEREIKILTTHTDPHIVELFGVIWNGKMYKDDNNIENPIYTGYVMEYMELGSLHNEIHDVSKEYDMWLIALWIQQIGYGLEYLHEHGILHRDVKPRNRIGTDSYMAPEIVGKEKNYEAPADVYSFGVTIWEIICRKHPREHITFENGCIELPIDPDKMSEDSWNFVKRCWQKEIPDRPSIQEIIDFEPKFAQTILVVGAGGVNKMAIWKQKASAWTVSRMKLPDLLSAGAVYLDDELYIINWDKSLFKLDKNMEWKQLADMNGKRGDINNSCLEWNGYIWVFGGWNSYDGIAIHLKSVERYAPKEDKWTRMPYMKYGRYHAAAAVCNGKIYICGGIGYGDVWVESVECFDPESGVWTELTDMPTPRSYHSLVWYRNKLVVIGGRDEEEDTTTVLELNLLEKNGQWKELSPLTSPSSASVAAVLGREIFTIGWDSTNDSPDVEIFNGINWRVDPSFPSNFPLPLIFPRSPYAVLVPQEFADRLSSYPIDLKQ